MFTTIRYFIDPTTDLPHIYNHNVSEVEIEEVFHNSPLTQAGRRSPTGKASRYALGQTNAGRYLKIIYSVDEDGLGVFVIAAYDLRGKRQGIASVPPPDETERPMRKKYRHYLPKGWTLDDVQAVAKYYDNQSEEEGAAVIEAAGEVKETFMVVPSDLVPRVQRLIKQHKSRNKVKTRRPKSRSAA